MRHLFRMPGMLALLAIVLLNTACDPEVATPCVDGVGERITDRRAMEAPFSNLILEAPVDVYLHNSTGDAYAEITAQQNVIGEITTNVENGTLVISNANCLESFKTVRIDLYLQSLSSLEINNSGDVYSETPFEAKEPLNLLVNGSGAVELIANAPSVNIMISGSGDVVLETETESISSSIMSSGNLRLDGVANTHTLKVEGSGNTRAFGLATAETFIQIDGSGDAEIEASDLLDVVIRGTGNVYYKGKPALNVDISGEGQIISVE
ncbi:MAG: head GIN domain-containing protein [Bacteroidota bacterium]